MVLKAVVLVGGKGLRLYPLTKDKPKCMVEVSGKPLIHWILCWLRANEVTHVVLCTGYMHEKVEKYVGDGGRWGMRVQYSVDTDLEEGLGTGGAVYNAWDLVEDSIYFYVVNGDILTDLYLARLHKFIHQLSLGVVATIPLRTRYGIVLTDRLGRIRTFWEKPVLYSYKMNAGVYLLSTEAKTYFREKCMLETDVFPRMASDGKLMECFYANINWISIETYKDLQMAEREHFYRQFEEYIG